MAFARFFVIFSVVVAVVSTTALAVEHNVGGTEGWRIGYNYTTWAQQQMFMVGDTLVFKYVAEIHNVRNVTGADFKTCTVSSNSKEWRSGKDVIELKTAGKQWYICSRFDHCKEGQKLAINVMESPAPAPAPNN